MQIKPEDDRCARWKRFLRIRSSRIGVWRHIKPFMPLFQLIERYPLGIECASKKCVALYDGLIFFFHNGSLSSYWVKTDGYMDLCAVYAERHCMEPMLDAKKCLGCHCMPVHFPTVRNWSVLCKR